MRGPARLLALLAVAAATQVAAAADRFVPADPGFVVANVRQAQPDEQLRDAARSPGARTRPPTDQRRARHRLHRTRAHACASRRTSAAPKPCSRRSRRSPTPAARCAGCTREVLQYRHDFAAAEDLLDALLRETPHDRRRAPAACLGAPGARRICRRARGLRATCRGAAESGATLGFACLAEALAGERQSRARAGAARYRARASTPTPMHRRAPICSPRAPSCANAVGDLDGAIADYREALKLAPRDDSIRAALADALAARGDARRRARAAGHRQTQSRLAGAQRRVVRRRARARA